MRGVLAGAAMLISIVMAASAAETPKHGGILTYMIPADAPPSFDGHRRIAGFPYTAPYEDITLKT